MPEIKKQLALSEKYILIKSPILLITGMIREENSWYCKRHAHMGYCEVLYIKNGSGQFNIGNRCYEVNTGDVIIINPGVFHEERVMINGPCLNVVEMLYCAVDNVFVSGLKDGCLLPEEYTPVIHSGQYRSIIEYCLTNIFNEINIQNNGYSLVCHNLVSILLVMVFRSANINNACTGEKATFASKINDYIKSNYTNDLSLQDLAQYLHISRHYLARFYKKVYGCSIINYVINLRIEEAKRLLLTTQSKISEISIAIGYRDQNYFSYLFKKMTGFSPSAYRNDNFLQIPEAYSDVSEQVRRKRSEL